MKRLGALFAITLLIFTIAVMLQVAVSPSVQAAVCTNTFTTRAGKGSTLTWAELDADISNASLVCGWADAPDLASGALTWQVTNDTSTGTTNKLVAKLSSGKAVKATTSDTVTGPLLGIVVSGGGTSGSAKIARAGTATCTFDAAATQGNYVILSNTTDGKCHDSGVAVGSAPSAAQWILGIVAATIGSAGDTTVLVSEPHYIANVLNTAGGTLNELASYGSSNGIIKNSGLTFSVSTLSTVSGLGGALTIQPTGPAVGAAGDTTIRGAMGGTNGNGGNVNISAGAKQGSGTNGSVIIRDGNGNATITVFDGVLTLSPNTSISASGMIPGRVFVPLAYPKSPFAAPTTAGTSDDCLLTATNLGSTPKDHGAPQMVNFDTIKTATMICRAKNAAAQSGTISCKIRNVTDGTDLVTAATSTSTTCTTLTNAVGGLALTGNKLIACMVSNATATDDPLFGSCSVTLEGG